jgi:ribonucleotide reductase alpha subunit
MSNEYTEKQLIENSLNYFSGNSLASDVWTKKYALKLNGKWEEGNPAETISRIVNEFVRMENNFLNPLSKEIIESYLDLFKHFIPAGSILFGLGNPYQISSLGNCFFIHNNADSYGGIFNLDESIVQLMKRRGGVGVTLENLRPAQSKVNNAAQTSTGAVSFAPRYSYSTQEVAQDGRRGALMISMHINHPDIKNFILMKDDLTKVTSANISVKVTDEFMIAVENDEDYILRWPVKKEQPILSEQIIYNRLYKREDGSYIMKVRAKELWEMIIKQAHKNAEPGVLFWDAMTKESPADCYKEFGFETLGTNPCVVGNTLIAVADGRNAVSIKQLSEEGKDVPVYCLNDNGKLSIKTMRNPRVTGYNQPIYKVTLENGHEIKVTENHKFRLASGEYKETKKLQYGDSLHILTKYVASLEEIFKRSNSRSANYWWLKNGNETNKSEHRFIYEQFSDNKIESGNVIHHKDFKSLNNTFENLESMSKIDHDIYHGNLIKGENNPYFKMSAESKYKFASHKGLSNHTAYQISNEEFLNKGFELGKQLGRRFNEAEWINYAEKNNLPKFITSFRGFNGIHEFSMYIASKLGYEYNDKDPRLLKRYNEALLNGYNVKITDNNDLIVERICEECKKPFWTYYNTREYAVCSTSCSNRYVNRTTDTNKRRKDTINKTYEQKEKIKTQNQLKIFSDLKFKLKKEPSYNEWIFACKENKIPYRLGTKYSLNSWEEVKEHAEFYNHKVILVELCGYENVYNGTVDNYHNFFCGGFEEKTKSNKTKLLFVNNLQCGEVGLSSHDSCRLGSINLNNVVKDPYTKDAKIDYNLLSKVTRVSQRLMDDIVSLEEEKIMAIIAKIKGDPEDPELKRTELNLWTKVLDVLKRGRRTGVGVLGLGDMLAKLGIKYGTKEATKLIDKVFETIAVNSYRESVQLAKERGCFPIWNADKEAQNPFIIRVISNHFTTEEYNDYLKYGRRNIANLSIAPTGTLALLAKTTSGIEPVFKIYYKRRRKINSEETNVHVDFKDDNGDSWQEYNVFHPEFIEWFVDTSKDKKFTNKQAEDFLKDLPDVELDIIVAKSPWAGSESYNVDYIEKVNMQGVIQKWIDHSISVTHNLPANISIEEVNKIYFQAWKSGCKGCTIYREGSRAGVLISNKKEDEFKKNDAPKRPRELNADYYVTTASGIKYAVIIGLWKDTNKPYEIFAFENPPMDKNVKGKIIKVKKGHYKFINGEFEIDNIQLAAERVEQRAHTIFLSMLLRHGAPIEHIVHVAKKVDENITSFSSACRRILSRYVVLEENERCPNCGSKLVREEGCVHCDSCEYSKC